MTDSRQWMAKFRYPGLSVAYFTATNESVPINLPILDAERRIKVILERQLPAGYNLLEVTKI